MFSGYNARQCLAQFTTIHHRATHDLERFFHHHAEMVQRKRLGQKSTAPRFMAASTAFSTVLKADMTITRCGNSAR